MRAASGTIQVLIGVLWLSSNQWNSSSPRWLNGTVLGIGLTSLLSDWSHEIATAVLPALLVSMGVGPGWLGAIEGVVQTGFRASQS